MTRFFMRLPAFASVEAACAAAEALSLAPPRLHAMDSLGVVGCVELVADAAAAVEREAARLADGAEVGR